MNIILFGGAFNPVHRGHLYIADMAARSFPDYRVVFFPSRFSPHKGNEGMIAPRHRIRMLRLALAGTPFLLDTWETRRPGISYTIKTVKYIYRKYGPEKKPLIMIGDDLVPTLKNWKRLNELAELADFLVFRREKEAPPIPDGNLPMQFLENPVMPLSSTEIRDMIRRGRNPGEVLSPGVMEYINKKNLYGVHHR